MHSQHFFKKQISWELMNIRLQKFLKEAALHKRETMYADNPITYYDMTNAKDFSLFITTVSDRGINEVLKTTDMFRARPYLSCSVITDETGSFRVNPSLLQAKLAIKLQPEQIVYTEKYDFWSPTYKYNSLASQEQFITRLKDQMETANQLEAKLKTTIKRKEIGKRKWLNIPNQAHANAQQIFADQLLQNGRKENISLFPITTPQTLVKETLFNQNKQDVPYNEVILSKSQNKNRLVSAIIFEENDFNNALNATLLENEDAMQAMDAIIQSGLPIIIIKNTYLYKEKMSAAHDVTTRLHYGCKMRDFTFVQNICREIDIKKYGGPALREACYLGDAAVATFLIEHGADVNFDQGLPLQAAFYRNNVNIAKLLLAKGADLSCCFEKLMAYLENRPNKELSFMLQTYLDEKAQITLRCA